MTQKRGRAWRRSRRESCIERRKAYVEVKFDGQLSKNKRNRIKNGCWDRSDKNWKQLYIRSVKTQRARQLGFEYPLYIWRQNQDLEDISPNIRP